jgi:hypothetical protein
MMADMGVIMQLLDGHQQIRRQVDDVDGNSHAAIGDMLRPAADHP